MEVGGETWAQAARNIVTRRSDHLRWPGLATSFRHTGRLSDHCVSLALLSTRNSDKLQHYHQVTPSSGPLWTLDISLSEITSQSAHSRRSLHVFTANMIQILTFNIEAQIFKVWDVVHITEHILWIGYQHELDILMLHSNNSPYYTLLHV